MLRFLLLISLLATFAFPGKSQQITAMTYNIRYDNPKDAPNAWDQRKDFLVSQVRFHAPVIMGVQEALKHQLDYIDQAFPHYQYIGVGRDDGGQSGEFSAVFYDSEQVKLKDHGTFWLSPTPERPSKGWDAALNRICTYGLFKPKGGKAFWVFNTHFDHIGQEARAESVKLILEQIQAKNTKGYPVILMGDLNLTPDTDPIQLLANQMKDTFTTGNFPSLGPEGTFTGFSWDSEVKRRIDYIFVSPGVQPIQTAILTDSKNQRYPSDHFPVISKLDLRD
ncbi:MAG TPA: endonuclease/exonuclease/phosphatase family protein [Saprospiraceae bacterium]|nr:endonuclease/exonuclease/phosphatase family protein [Saprospiraceae bacterium]